jgi:large subunit ribosomal protein L22
MEARAVAKEIRISADRTRLVIDLIRGKGALEAMDILRNLHNKASRVIEKVLGSAISNAENNLGLDKTKLYVSKCVVDEGKILKRHMFDSRGHVGRNDHRTSHITVIVSEKQV